MDDHGEVASGTHHTIAVNHHGDGASTALADTIQDADSGSGSGGGTHLAPVSPLGNPDYNDTHFPHPDHAYQRSEANTAAVALAPPHDRMCSTNNCKRFSRFTFTDFEWPACCTLCYSQGSSSHSSTCDASQGTCTTRGCQRRLNSDPLVGWHPVGERFCCIDCINTAGSRHSATCDDTSRSGHDIEPSASHANAPSRLTAALTLTLVLSPLPLVPRILAVILTTFATLAHGAPSTSPVYGPGVLLSALLTLSYADEQRPPLPCVTIHVYDPTAHFHTVYTVNQPHPGFESDQSQLVYGDSDSEAALFRSIYGASDHESDSGMPGMPHNPYVSQQGYELPSTQDGLATQLGDHTTTSPSADTPAYTSFLHGLLTQIRDDTDSESDGPLVPDGQSLDDAEPDPGPISTLDDLQPMHSDHELRSNGEPSACDDACDDDSDLQGGQLC